MHHVCVHNWLEYLNADPEGDDPVIRALASVGIDITRELPRPSSSVVRAGDVEVVAGCGSSCPSTAAPPAARVA